MPINDIIPGRSGPRHFLLQPDEVDLDDSTIPAETVRHPCDDERRWVEFSLALPNATEVVYRVSASI
ncbi:hypothetical protein M8494_04635 [Serratia ureilytica]